MNHYRLRGIQPLVLWPLKNHCEWLPLVFWPLKTIASDFPNLRNLSPMPGAVLSSSAAGSTARDILPQDLYKKY